MSLARGLCCLILLGVSLGAPAAAPPELLLPELVEAPPESALPGWFLPVEASPRLHLSLLLLQGTEAVGDPDAARLAATWVDGRLAEALEGTLARFELSLAVGQLRLDLDLPADGDRVALEEALALASRALCGDTFPRARLARLARSLHHDEGGLQGLLWRAQARALYPPEHPFGRIPDPDHLATLDGDDAGAAWVELRSAGRPAVVAVGPRASLEVVEAWRPACPGGFGGEGQHEGLVAPQASGGLVVVDMPGQGVARVLVAWILPAAAESDSLALDAALVHLAEGDRSRLTRALRGERGWAYSVEAGRVAGRGHGRARVLTEVEPDELPATLSLIEAELERLAGVPLETSELAALVADLERRQLTRLESPGDLRDLLVGRFLDGLGPPRSLPSLEPGQVQEAAARWLRRDRATIFVVGDGEVVQGILGPAGFPVDEVWDLETLRIPR